MAALSALLVCALFASVHPQGWSTGGSQYGQQGQQGSSSYGQNDRYGANSQYGGSGGSGSQFGSGQSGFGGRDGNSLDPFRSVFEWNSLDFTWPDEMTKQQALTNRRFIPENNALAGIRVWRDRIFLTVPRWKEGVPVTLASVSAQPVSGIAPRLDPFPNWQMQEIGNCSALQFVQNVEVDTEGRIWILDTGRTNILSGTGQNGRCPPKLVIIDLNSVSFPYSGMQVGGFSGQNPQYPGQNPQYPGQNTQYPGQNSQYPGQNPQYPGQNTQYPGQNNQFGQNSQYPNNQGQYNQQGRQFGNNPNQQYNPNNPNQQYNPNSPNQPYNPNSPNQPYNPSNPNQPYNPSNPNQPYNPSNPNQPYNPSNPNQPYNPNNPNQPYNPSGNAQFGSNYPGQQQNFSQYDQFGNFVGNRQGGQGGQGQYPGQGNFNPSYNGPSAFNNYNFRIVKSFNFPSNVAQQFGSYLKDLVLDNSNGWYAYITDHGEDPGIIVYSFREDRSWKVKDVRSMRSDPDTNFLSVNSIDVELRGKNIDGIALSPSSGYERTLYYSPLGSYNLYSVPTSALKNANQPSDISSSVRDLGRKRSVSDGMIMDNRGNLYFGLLGLNAIGVWDSNRGRFDDSQRILAKDQTALQWVDSFSFDDAGNLYVVTNRLQNFLTGRVNINEPNYRILRASLGARSYQNPADLSGKNSVDGRSNDGGSNYWGSGYNSYYYNSGQTSAFNVYLFIGLLLMIIGR